MPNAIPKTIETGICIKLAADTLPPCAKDVNAVKNTITNTSSTDAAAIIIDVYMRQPRI